VSARMPRSDSDFTLSACRTVSFGGGDSLLRAEKTGVTSRRSRRLMGKLSRLREGCGPTLSSIGNGAQIRPRAMQSAALDFCAALCYDGEVSKAPTLFQFASVCKRTAPCLRTQPLSTAIENFETNAKDAPEGRLWRAFSQ